MAAARRASSRVLSAPTRQPTMRYGGFTAGPRQSQRLALQVAYAAVVTPADAGRRSSPVSVAHRARPHTAQARQKLRSKYPRVPRGTHPTHQSVCRPPAPGESLNRARLAWTGARKSMRMRPFRALRRYRKPGKAHRQRRRSSTACDRAATRPPETPDDSRGLIGVSVNASAAPERADPTAPG
jgi:hypothetical protein